MVNSILPIASTRPVIPEDLNINPVQNTPMANVIIDGRIMKGNLQSTGKMKHHDKATKTENIIDINEVMLANLIVQRMI